MDQRTSAVLLVDRDRRVRVALRTLLTAAGFVVAAEAGDPRTALSAARLWRPQIAVVDPQLPTAAAGCALIEELHGEFGTVVIALTSDSRLLEPARTAGATQVLTKDCAPEDLLAALHRGAAAALGPPRNEPTLTSARGGTGCAGLD
jgi:DNA-binding NarL/FixJ family response regulator